MLSEIILGRCEENFSRYFYGHRRQTFKCIVFLIAVVVIISLLLAHHGEVDIHDSIESIKVETISDAETFNKPGKYNFNKLLVKPDNLPDKLLFLVLISSSAGSQKHSHRRAAIRKTWGNCYDQQLQSSLQNQSMIASLSGDGNSIIDYQNCRILFFVGETGDEVEDENMRKEASVYKDIIIVGVKENYRNITWKLRSAMEFISHYDIKYVVKSDDDVYIHLPRLVQYIATGPGFSKPIYGGTTYSGKVVRDPTHRHFVHEFDYGERYYPLYCKGSMIVLSGNLLPSVVGAFSHLKPFNIDDAYLGITLNKLGVAPFRLQKIVQFQHLPVFLDYLHLCDFSWLVGVGDGLDAPRIHSVHRAMMMGEGLPPWMCLHLNLYPLLFMFIFVIFAIAAMKARHIVC